MLRDPAARHIDVLGWSRKCWQTRLSFSSVRAVDGFACLTVSTLPMFSSSSCQRHLRIVQPSGTRPILSILRMELLLHLHNTCAVLVPRCAFRLLCDWIRIHTCTCLAYHRFYWFKYLTKSTYSWLVQISDEIALFYWHLTNHLRLKSDEIAATSDAPLLWLRSKEWKISNYY